MSAYIVDREHILFLTACAMTRGEYLSSSICQRRDLTPHQVAQILWDENIASVRYRYPNGGSHELPGPCDDFLILASEVTHALEYRCHNLMTAAAVFKSCACYEYQSCEHPEWHESEAKSILDDIRKWASARIPGYEDAPWGSPLGK